MAATQKPNIIFIMADDMGYGDVGCYNPQSKIPTPNMDRLAREGIRFTDAHSPSALCTPIHHSGNGVFSLRQAEWKCIFETSGSGGWPPPVGTPPKPGAPGEQQNLWDIRPRVVADLTALWESYKEIGRSVPSRRS